MKRANKVRRCECGLPVSSWPATQETHNRSWWHANHARVLSLRRRGLSAARIANMFGVTRATAARYLKKWEKNKK